MDQEDFFSGLTANRWSKIITLLFTEIMCAMNIFFVCCIIWHEVKGSDQKITVINRLFTVCWLLLICWLGLNQQVDTARYVFGPFPKFVCYFNVWLKFYITTHFLLLLDTVIVLRYIWIFWIKNPSSFKDEFWSTFMLTLQSWVL